MIKIIVIVKTPRYFRTKHIHRSVFLFTIKHPWILKSQLSQVEYSSRSFPSIHLSDIHQLSCENLNLSSAIVFCISLSSLARTSITSPATSYQQHPGIPQLRLAPWAFFSGKESKHLGICAKKNRRNLFSFCWLAIHFLLGGLQRRWRTSLRKSEVGKTLRLERRK